MVLDLFSLLVLVLNLFLIEFSPLHFLFSSLLVLFIILLCKILLKIINMIASKIKNNEIKKKTH